MKKIISAVMSAVMLFACVISVCTSAAADENVIIDYKVTYNEDGIAYIEMFKESSGNTIRYTADGSTPTKNSKKYTKKLKTDESRVIRAAEYDNNGKKIKTLKITLSPRTADVTVRKVKYLDKFKITISHSDENAEIYYTTDGSTPSRKSEKYTKPIIVEPGTRVKAAAYSDGMKRSGIFSAKFGEAPKPEEPSYDVSAAVSPEETEDEIEFKEYMYKMLEFLNEERAKYNSQPLELDIQLCEAALIRAEETTEKFSHTRPDGRPSRTVLSDIGYVSSKYLDYSGTHTIVGENIAQGQKTVNEVVKEWFESKSHWQNIVHSKYRKIGIAYIKADDKYKHYWVQIFSS